MSYSFFSVSIPQKSIDWFKTMGSNLPLISLQLAGLFIFIQPTQLCNVIFKRPLRWSIIFFSRREVWSRVELLSLLSLSRNLQGYHRGSLQLKKTISTWMLMFLFTIAISVSRLFFLTFKICFLFLGLFRRSVGAFVDVFGQGFSINQKGSERVDYWLGSFLRCELLRLASNSFELKIAILEEQKRRRFYCRRGLICSSSQHIKKLLVSCCFPRSTQLACLRQLQCFAILH